MERRSRGGATRRLAWGWGSILAAIAVLAPGPASARAGDANAPSCPNEASAGFRAYLADCRAYELVSPPYKGGYALLGPEFRSQDGAHAIAASTGTFAGDESGSLAAKEYELSRGEGGEWSARAISPPAARYPAGELLDASPDLSATLWRLTPAGASAPGLYVRDSRDAFYPVGPLTAPNAGAGSGGSSGTPLAYRGASGDLSHLVLSQSSGEALAGELLFGGAAELWPGDTTYVDLNTIESLYEYEGAGGAEPALVGVSNAERLAGTPVNAEAELISRCGTVLGSGEGRSLYNAVSADGETVFFTARAGEEAASGGRESECGVRAGGKAIARYVKVPYEGPYACAPAGGECPAGEPARIEAAIAQKLTEDEATVPPLVRSYENLSCSSTPEYGCEARVTLAPRSAPPVDELYARLGGERTLALSEPPLTIPGRECTNLCAQDEQEPQLRGAAVFQGASQDGSRVYFTTRQPLVNADADAGADLYTETIGCPAGAAGCGPAQRRVTGIVQVSSGATGGSAEVQGVARISPDGERVWYVAKGVLTTEPDLSLAPGRQSAVAGEDNLYMFDAATGRNTFVATLSPADAEEWSAKDDRSVQVSVNGRFLVFASAADLTPGDTSTVAQLFEYDAQSERLARVSVGRRGSYECALTGEVQDGYNCDGNSGSEADAPQIAAPDYEARDSPSMFSSALNVSDDGMVVFASADALTPHALNNAMIGCLFELGGVCYLGSFANNVYEYEGGNVYLVSDGRDITADGLTGASNVQSFGTDASGQDVFFQTTDALVPGDGDSQLDIYDARAGGGLLEALEPAGCAAGCPGTPSFAPPASPPASATQPGGGNLAPPASKPSRKVRPLTRAQKLRRALQACRRKPRRQRHSCEAGARRRYAPKATSRRHGSGR